MRALLLLCAASLLLTMGSGCSMRKVESNRQVEKQLELRQRVLSRIPIEVADAFDELDTEQPADARPTGRPS